ncbi:MAG: hypothetical protein Q7T44_10560 [Parvibaculum sp.]|nr:hypothetical protein [Parvibaculum sp.]
MLQKFIGIVIAAGLLAGCGMSVQGRIDYAAQAPRIPTVGAGQSIALGVQDVRPYVLSGESKPSYVTTTRNGLGAVAAYLTTRSEKPLANDLVDAISRALEENGAHVTGTVLSSTQSGDKAFDALSKSGADKVLSIAVREWRTDLYPYRDPMIYLDMSAQVFDKSGKLLGENTVTAKGEFVKLLLGQETQYGDGGVAQTYQDKLRELLSAPQIVAALK